ncbi:hypothetical protein AB4Z21_26660 [Paenibacillus sp. MCAF20]
MSKSSTHNRHWLYELNGGIRLELGKRTLIMMRSCGASFLLLKRCGRKFRIYRCL